MGTHTIHPALPSGFHFADRLQTEAYMQSGFVDGASKVVLVDDPEGGYPLLACRLRPPYDEAYAADYRDGWAAGKRQAGGTGLTPAYDDGYRDASEGRMKWHLAHCPNHGDHSEGCGA